MVELEHILSALNPALVRRFASGSDMARDIAELIIRAVDYDGASALPPPFLGIDMDDEDDVFEAVVEAVAEKYGLDDEQTARVGLLADEIYSLIDNFV